MSLNIFKKEFIRSLPHLIIWVGILGGVILLGMLFYPTLMEGGLMDELSTLFETPLMKNLMAAFGIDIQSMTNVLGFYVAYGTLYVMLLGCIYSIMLASQILSKEESNKTAEFLLTKPITRTEIYVSKVFFVFTNIFIVNLFVVLVGFMSLEFFKVETNKIINISDKSKEEMVLAFQKKPIQFKEEFNIDEDMYVEYLITKLMMLVDTSKKELSQIEAAEINEKDIENLLEDFSKSPGEFIESVKSDPEKYMEMFNVKDEDKDKFINQLNNSIAQFEQMKENFNNDPLIAVEMFRDSPTMIVEQFRNKPVEWNRIGKQFGISSNTMEDVFIYYRLDNFLIISFYTFLLMLTSASIGLFISLLIKRGRQILGVSIGIVLSSYFIDAISKVSPKIDKFGYISPFKFVDTAINDINYGLEWWRLLYLIGVPTILFTVSIIIYRKKDILI